MTKIIPILILLLEMAQPVMSQSSPVIIELFTSQGCSSCPAADKNLSAILLQADKEGKPVYGLSFHVDYWNYIGWKDPYSRKEFTERQRKYGEEMNLRSIYTPQMIVNGKVEFVGSNKSTAIQAIEIAGAQKAICLIRLSSIQLKDKHLSFNYDLNMETTDEHLNIAIVEKEVENYVPRGENAGKKLHHDNIVRLFTSVDVTKEGKIDVVVPVDLDRKKASLIVYLQRKNNEIIGASMSTF